MSVLCECELDFLAMECGSEEENKTNTPEGENKVKRKMKSASQLELLEKTYAGM